MTPSHPKSILLLSGLSGAGKTTALKTLEDMGWEVVDNLPLMLLDRLLDTPLPAGHGADADRPLALGIDARTRGFDANAIVRRIKALRERELTEPLRRWASQVIDTTSFTSNALQQEMRSRFARPGLSDPVLTILSFGFSRGVPRNADLMFDMRYLRNPHWDDALRPKTGLEADVAAYIAEDPAYDDSVGRIEDLLVTLLPRYAEGGKTYITVAFGCTGGRHRSVHVADRVARHLQAAGFSPTVLHRNIESAPQDSLEKRRPGGPKA